jgi:hypothetical protein
MNSCSLMNMCFRTLIYHSHNDSVTEVTTLLCGTVELVSDISGPNAKMNMGWYI